MSERPRREGEGSGDDEGLMIEQTRAALDEHYAQHPHASPPGAEIAHALREQTEHGPAGDRDAPAKATAPSGQTHTCCECVEFALGVIEEQRSILGTVVPDDAGRGSSTDECNSTDIDNCAVHGWAAREHRPVRSPDEPTDLAAWIDVGVGTSGTAYASAPGPTRRGPPVQSSLGTDPHPQLATHTREDA